jgi:hypothetical protein
MLRDFSWFQPTARNFPVTKRQLRVWRYRGRDYRQTGTYELLVALEAERAWVDDESNARRAVHSLLPSRHRRTLKLLSESGSLDVIRYYMAYCPAGMVPICVWLIGKRAKRYQTCDLEHLARDASPTIRKHVAKALRRLESWPELEDMAVLFPDDEKVQWYAKTPIAHRAFKERLNTFVHSLDDSHAGEVKTPSQMPYWAAQKTWDMTPPKSIELIRRMLRRIRHWVRWGFS